MQNPYFSLTDTGLKSGGGVLENLLGRTVALFLLVTLCAFENSDLRAANQINVSPDGPVYATATAADGTVYFGGSFTKLNPQTGGGALLNSTSGQVSLAFPYVHGNVYAAIPDGSGGWYIGGSFDKVGGQNRTNLAQINSSGVVTTWSPSADGFVFALALDATRGRVFVGGAFASINNTASPNLASVDTTDGTLSAWQWTPDDVVYSIAISGNNLYFGGDFVAVNGADQQKIAWVDLSNNSLKDWNPKPYGGSDPGPNIASVTALAVNGTTVIAGGSFTKVAGVSKTGLVAIGSDGIPTAWNPVLVNGGGALPTVYALALAGNKLYVGGSFTAVDTAVGLSPRSNIAAFDDAAGELTLSTWAPAIDNGVPSTGEVRSLAVSTSTVYVGGVFTTVDGLSRKNAAAIAIDPISVTAWDPQPDQDVYALAINGNGSSVFVGGLFSTLGGKPRLNLAAFNSDGTISNWDPQAEYPNHAVSIQTLTVSGTSVYIGGSFSSIKNTARNNLAAVDLTAGTPTSWDPGANGMVFTLLASGDRIYAGGNFTSIGGTDRSHVAAIKSDGTLWDWNPGTDGSVYSIVVAENSIYLGGQFLSVASTPRNNLAGIDISGTVLNWNPNANDTVFSLQVPLNVPISTS